MSIEKDLDLLQQALAGIKAHAAGLHASADMAQRIIAGIRESNSGRVRADDLRGRFRTGDNGPLHYGEADPKEMVEHLESISGGVAPIPAFGGDTPTVQE